jgi:hypothetical protein
MNEVEISCREQDEGGSLDPLKAWLSVRDLRGSTHVMLLIHGYNNTVDEARESYKAFLDDGAGSPDWTFGAMVVKVFWPGDAAWGIARPLFYPWALPAADRTAELLAEIVKDLCAHCAVPLTLDIAAHSMGNRVALRMQSLLDGQNLHIRRVVHMAAAVPTHRLQTSGDELRKGLMLESSSGKVLSMYSENDFVLAIAFPLGETAAFPTEGVLPVALGHEWWAGSSGIADFEQRDANPAGHSDYWRSTDTKKSARAALELGPAAPRSTAFRNACERTSDASTVERPRGTMVRVAGSSL